MLDERLRDMRLRSKSERAELAADIVEGRIKLILTDTLVAQCCGVAPSYLSRKLAERRAAVLQKSDVTIVQSLMQAAE
jgi:hypothetical protein